MLTRTIAIAEKRYCILRISAAWKGLWRRAAVLRACRYRVRHSRSRANYSFGASVRAV
jgi:hypothetical protein